MSEYGPEVPRYITVGEACRIIGGNKPIHPATFHRGVKEGRYPPPDHPSPNISRVDLAKLIAALKVLTDTTEGA